MTRLLSSAHALNGATIVLLLLTLFHAAILLGFAPSDVVWGGRIENPRDVTFPKPSRSSSTF